MDRPRLLPRLSLPLAATLTLLGAILRSVCMLTSFEPDVGYFRAGVLPTICNALYVVAVAAAVVCALLIPKGTLPGELPAHYRMVASFPLGAALAVFTVASFVACWPTHTNDLLIAPTLLGLLASTYFFVSGRRGSRYPDWLSALGFLPVLWCMAAVAETYTDPFTTMNSPIKITLQLGFLGLTLILLAELRFRLGKPCPRGAVAFMSIGMFCCLNAAVPVLVATAAERVDNILHMLYAVVLLCGAAYGFCLLLSLVKATERKIPQ